MANKEKPTTFRKRVNVSDIIEKQEGLISVKPETRRNRRLKGFAMDTVPLEERKRRGKKSAEIKAEKQKEAKTFAEAFELLSNLVLNLDSDKPVTELLDKFGIKPTERQIIAFNQLQMAKQDSKTFGAVRDTMGEVPTQKQEVAFEGRVETGNIINKWLGEVDDK